MKPKKTSKKINVKTKKHKDNIAEQPTTAMVWSPIDIIQHMDRLFSDYSWMPTWWKQWRNTPSWSGAYIDSDTKMTPVDLVDLGKEFKIVAEMPGVSKKDLDIHITPTGVRICGEAKTEIEEEHDGYLRRERSYSTLCRNMPFPEEVNPDKAEATLNDGILEIIVAKKEPTKAKGRTVPVK